MSFISNHSCECAKSELDLFQVPGTQTSILKGQWVEYSPVSALTAASTQIEFQASSSGDQYIDLNHTKLYVKCKIIKHDGTNLAAETVAPVNLILQSLFNQVNITLNDTLISHTDIHYPYRALIETLLNYSTDALDSQLTNSLFYKDTSGNMDSFDILKDNAKNYGLLNRLTHFSNGKSVELLGPIHSDIFFQPKYLLSGVDLKIKLNRNKHTFCLMSNQAVDYQIIIEDCKLYLRKVVISPPVLIAHAHALLRGTAKYPIDRTVVKSISISQGMRNCTQDNLFFGQIPKNLILCMVDNEGFSGNYKKNPFNFQHFNLNYLALYLDNEQYPFKPLQLDFDNHLYLNAYNTLFSGTGKMFKDVGTIISREDYAEGYCFFCYDLSPDLETQDHYSLQKNGDLRIDLQFAKPLPVTINLIIYAVFENIIEIDSKRRVTHDYTS